MSAAQDTSSRRCEASAGVEQVASLIADVVVRATGSSLLFLRESESTA